MELMVSPDMVSLYPVLLPTYISMVADLVEAVELPPENTHILAYERKIQMRWNQRKQRRRKTTSTMFDMIFTL